MYPHRRFLITLVTHQLTDIIESFFMLQKGKSGVKKKVIGIHFPQGVEF